MVAAYATKVSAFMTIAFSTPLYQNPVECLNCIELTELSDTTYATYEVESL